MKMSTNQKILLIHVLFLMFVLNSIDAHKKSNFKPQNRNERVYNSDTHKLSPVILVPGVGGNKLHAKLDKLTAPHLFCSKQSSYYDLWLDPTQFVPVAINCWVDNMKLHYDKVSRTTSNTPGVNIKLPSWGQTDELENVDSSIASQVNKFGHYYFYIVDALVKRGYVRELSIFGAPYDFRKGPNEEHEWFKQLKNLAENAYMTNGQTGVTFIVHSLGAKMILCFLQQMSQSWKDQYVKRVISLSGVFGGSIKSILAVSAGYDLGVQVIPSSKMKLVQRTFPSIVWTMPLHDFWGPNDVLATIGQTDYTLKNIDDFFSAFGVRDVIEMRKDLAKYNNFTAPGVEMHCLLGENVKTPEKLKFNSIRSKPKMIMGNGDGTVNMRGLLGCKMWKDSPSQGKHAVHQRKFSGVDHFDILGNARVIEYILETLIGDRANSRANQILENKDIMKIRLI